MNLIPVRDKVGRGGVLYKRTMGEIFVILRITLGYLRIVMDAFCVVVNKLL